MLRIHTILAAVDFDEYLCRIARTAVQFAHTFGGRLHFLHVNEPMAGTPSLVAGSLHTRAHTADELKESVSTHVPSELLSSVNTEYIVEKGDVVKTIIEKAEELEVDLIVIGNPSESSVLRFFSSPTEDGVLHRAMCDIYAVSTHRK
ncbi:MAG: universal stress protein [Acidobacteria bacterium]|nr:universal stress protein [Acidobacteriota bacterium]